MPESPLNSLKTARPPGSLAAVWAIVMLALVLAGYFNYRQEEAQFGQATRGQLAAIADLKVEQIVQWRRERLADATLVRQTPYAARRALDFLALTNSTNTRRMFTGWLEPLLAKGPYQALLLDGELRVRLTHPARTAGELGEAERGPAEQALRTRQVVIADWHRLTEDGSPLLSFLVPLVTREGGDVPAAGLEARPTDRGAAVLVLRINTRQAFDYSVGSWPLPSRSGEMVLARREGGEAVVLNELRHRTNAALRLRFLLSRRELPAMRAVLGERGIIEERDYRGVPVLAATRPIPGTPWFLITKVDREEALAPMRARAWGTGLFVAVLAASASLALVVLWGRQKLALTHQRLAEASNRQLLAERVADLTRQANEELARFNRLATGRELRVIELKQQVNNLAAQLGQPRPYPLAFLDAAAAEVVRTTPKPGEDHQPLTINHQPSGLT